MAAMAIAGIRQLWRELLPSSSGQRNATTVPTHAARVLNVSLGRLGLGRLGLGLGVWLCSLHATFWLAKAFTCGGFWLWRQLIEHLFSLLSWLLSAGPWPRGHTTIAAWNISLRAFGTKELLSAWV